MQKTATLYVCCDCDATMVADPYHFNADPDPAFNFIAAPDAAFHFNGDPDPALSK